MRRESAIQRNIVKMYRKHGCFVVKMDPNPLGVPPGFPDLMVLGPGGATVFLEVKRPQDGKLTPLQDHTIGHLRKLGHRALVVRSEDECPMLWQQENT